MTKRIIVDTDERTHHAVKQYALDNNKSIKDVVLEMLKKKLKLYKSIDGKQYIGQQEVKGEL